MKRDDKEKIEKKNIISFYGSTQMADARFVSSFSLRLFHFQ